MSWRSTGSGATISSSRGHGTRGNWGFSFRLQGSRQAGALARGDCDNDGEVNLADAACVLNWLFLGAALGCPEAADVDAVDAVNLTDAFVLLSHLFVGGPPLAEPFPGCGGASDGT